MSTAYKYKADAKYTEFLKTVKNVQYPKSISVTTVVAAPDYRTLRHGLYLLGISEEQSFDSEVEVKKRFVELFLDFINFFDEEIKFYKAQVIYKCNEGSYELAIGGKIPIKMISKATLLGNIKKIDLNTGERK